MNTPMFILSKPFWLMEFSMCYRAILSLAVLLVLGCQKAPVNNSSEPERSPHLTKSSEKNAPVDESTETDRKNGFAEIVAAADLANRLVRKDIATDAGKRSYVAAGAEAMQMARRGLAMECVPDDIRRRGSSADSTDHFDVLMTLFDLTGDLAIQDQETDAAIEAYVDCVRLAGVTCRGGNLAEQMHSLADINNAARSIRAMRESLTEAQCRHAIEAFSEAMTTIEPAEIVARREIGQIVSLQDRQVAPALKRQAYAINLCRAKCDLCTCVLAIRMYYLAHAHLPNTLDDLTGGYLHEMPSDPWTGKPPVYRLNGEAYEVFFVGPKGEVRL